MSIISWTCAIHGNINQLQCFVTFVWLPPSLQYTTLVLKQNHLSTNVKWSPKHRLPSKHWEGMFSFLLIVLFKLQLILGV